VQVDFFTGKDAFQKNVPWNTPQRRALLVPALARKASTASAWYRPAPAFAIQVNLEYLAQTVWTDKLKEGKATSQYAYPDTLVGTDSHTTMINGLSVLGLGRGRHRGRSRDARQPISMLIPEFIGMRFTGSSAPASPRPISC